MTTGSGDLRFGRVTGGLRTDPLAVGPRRGRVRRWSYAAAGGVAADGRPVVAGAAVARLGPVCVAFAYATIGERTVVFDGRASAGPRRSLGPTPVDGARYGARGAALHLRSDGGFSVEALTADGPLSIRVRTTADVLPVVLTTRTPGGGWNTTEKAAGTAAELEVEAGAERARTDDASGWRDWTAGRQDRRTSWRWAAGAGWAATGETVGMNVSTGMNGCAEGEDLLWVEGRPHALTIEHLAPLEDGASDGPWSLTGPGTELALERQGVRQRREQLLVLASEYVQPIGRWHGQLAADGQLPRSVEMFGVAEDHHARW